MNSDDLALFAHVVKAGSVTRAALEVGVDQSTISRRIGALEAELGVRLLHRSGRGVAATERGQKLLEYSRSIEKTLDDARLKVGGAVGHIPTRLHIAAQPTIAHMVFPLLATTFRDKFPGMGLRFVEASASHILEKLGDGDLDFALVYVPEKQGALRFDSLLHEEVRLVTPAEFNWPSDVISSDDLERIPLILPSTHFGLRLLLESQAEQHKFRLNLALECDGSISLIKSLVVSNAGCTVLPQAAVADECANGRLKTFRMDIPGMRRTVGLTMGRNRVLPEGLWEVMRVARLTIRSLLDSGGWPDAMPAEGEAGGLHLHD